MRRPTVLGGTERFYYLRDSLGSIVAVTDSNAQVRKRHVYEDPYGQDVVTDDNILAVPKMPIYWWIYMRPGEEKTRSM